MKIFGRCAAGAFLLAVSCFLVAEVAERDQPLRTVDGRVEPTIRPLPHRSPEERRAVFEKTNKLRDDLLSRFPLPITFCQRVEDDRITVDGKLDEAEWQQAAVVHVNRQAKDGSPCAHDTRARLLWDSVCLYIAFECDDPDVIATLKEHDAELWRDDCAEIFINPSGDEMSYLELETNPLGAFYDASIADYRPEVDWDLNSNHLDMDQTIRGFRTVHSKVAVHVDGTIGNSSDTDKGWTCEFAIAFSDIARGTNVLRPSHPQDGDVWRMGLYRINYDTDRKSPDKKVNENCCWNPTGTWFHRPWLFGRVVFIDKPSG